MSTSNWRSMNEQELAELFRKLGAQDPEGWAHSQIREGIPQLARYMFLRLAWQDVVGPEDQSWISENRPKDPNGPGGEFGPAIDRLLAAGARIEDLTTVVRIMQWGLLFRFCMLLDDPADLEDEVEDLWWGLFLVDNDGNPLEPVDGLHESVLEVEPTGLEMCPPRANGR
jgi:hypothetical protein